MAASANDPSPTPMDESSLGSEDKIELQAFLERQSWIEEKIKLLEQMPPIEVFVGLEQLLNSSAPVNGLPSREELQAWLSEHDKISIETEQFDKGDMIRLKKFAKAKSNQNLSPEDTDLIEVTLTTLLALDKLFHLLRVRSDNLDLLGLRLSWEEQRLRAWKEREKILADLDTFIKTRARWSPASYDNLQSADGPSQSTSTNAPSPSNMLASSTSLSPLSRSVRFRHTEAMSREAASFASRVVLLKKEVIFPAGKVLDKMIENSRQAVPDAIMDEQDKLENNGEAMNGLGKFALGVAMQWKAADEIYCELKNDQVTAQSLFDEIQNAKEHHPTSKLSEAFTSRSAALSSRLSGIGDPSVSRTFPRPLYPSFPDQQAANLTVTSLLSSELATTLKQSRVAASAAKAYQAGYLAVKQCETLSSEMTQLSTRLGDITTRLTTGTSAEDGDGSPPDLSSSDCLDSLRHGAYLALLPTLSVELEQADSASQRALKDCRITLLELANTVVDPAFKSDIAATMDQLEEKRGIAAGVKKEMVVKVERLREARKVWGAIGDGGRSLEGIRREVTNAMDRHRWRSQRGRDGSPLTPESPEPSRTPITITPSAILQQLEEHMKQTASTISTPLAALAPTIPETLSDSLTKHADDLASQVRSLRSMVTLWEGIQRQAGVMREVMDETHDIEDRVDNVRARLEAAKHDVLNGNGDEGEREDEGASEGEDALKREVDGLRDQIKIFTDRLSSRVPFVAPFPEFRFPTSAPSSRTVSGQFTTERTGSSDALPFSLHSLDQAVRGDADACSLSLAGGVDVLDRKLAHLRLAKLSRQVDAKAQDVLDKLRFVEQEFGDRKAAFDNGSLVLGSSTNPFAESSAGRVEELAAFRLDLDKFWSDHGAHIGSLQSIVQEALATLQSAPGAQDSSIHESLLLPRTRAVENLALRIDAIAQQVRALVSSISEAENRERARLDAEERDRMSAADKARFQAEERARMDAEKRATTAEEKIRLDAEEKARLELERELWESEQAKIVKDAEQSIPEVPPTPPRHGRYRSQDVTALRVRVASLRSQLRAIGINALARPGMVASSSNSMSALSLPNQQEFGQVKLEFGIVVEGYNELPSEVADTSVNTELKSLKYEIEASRPLLQRIQELAKFTAKAGSCDLALSDLLEHIDSYPEAPSTVNFSHMAELSQPPEEQLSARVKFCNSMIDEMKALSEVVSDDTRIIAERTRIEQTWIELFEMSQERISAPLSSRPSGQRQPSTPATRPAAPSRNSTRGRGYDSLSRGKPGAQGNVTPDRPRPSGSNPDLSARSSSRYSNRSVSGPTASTPASSLYASTYSSRQRTNSITSANSPSVTSSARKQLHPPVSTPRIRNQTGLNRSRRSASPALSEASSFSATSTPVRPGPSWTRPPRPSFGSASRTKSKDKDEPVVRKPYVPDTKNQLDVAIGKVVNELPVHVDINVEPIPVGWQDQSGKYWIGDSDPKLCFCRILRSQTVMVRVGGGWVELSKFIKDHFAHLFRIMPPGSPPNVNASREERWISSSTLLETPEPPTITATPSADEPPYRPPSTPEPKNRPQGGRSSHLSPHSLSPTVPFLLPRSPVSPLAPLQFIRRADVAELTRPSSPLAGRSAQRTARLSPAPPIRNGPPRSPSWRP
ncbi:hypothetical protein BOTBODRAFT_50789 [Botryobasidium botryosum FD-172 SS1]|uniref:GAR domain-containing protein n=1 Tax=Botryobasidium botryosum (strain FD-172 SS1) TaxID=930990 RepID=A0A067MYM9_BOTB1|nr:hypothetical protein BOTBODRAFT_50789 [Botryobasidium botryosum FD-172 SS1]